MAFRSTSPRPRSAFGGETGLAGKVDTHFFERFGSAMLLSVVGGLSALGGNTGVIVAGGGQSAAAAAVGQSGSDRPDRAGPAGRADPGVHRARPRFFARERSVSAALSLLAMNDHQEPSLPPAAPRSVYLDAYLAPLMPWLERETVTEILVNRPGELWVEDAEQPGMQRISLPELDDQLLQRLAEQVARISHQGINREHPLLAATLPDATGRARSSWSARRRRGATGRWRSAVTVCSTCRSMPMIAARSCRGALAPCPIRWPSRSPFCARRCGGAGPS
jgi:hypothetical protein